jgi:hypothetical protein
LGTFANNNVELFSPWNWSIGMWETLHLFSRYAKDYSVSSTSSLENTVSAYTSVNDVADAMTVIIVNKDMNASRSVTVNINGFSAINGNSETLQISSLPATETFVSHTNNALKKSTVSVNSNAFTITVPALSTTAVLLKSSTLSTNEVSTLPASESVMIYPNPVKDKLQVKFNLTIAEPTEMVVYNLIGQKLKVMTVNSDQQSIHTLDVSSLSAGSYFLSVKNSSYQNSMPFIIAR